MPDPIKSRLSKLYGVIRPPAPPRTESVSFPPDIDDAEDLRSFLADTDVFGPAIEEGAGYLWHALERFRITLAITPEVTPGGRVLELGANPHFFTRMLTRRGLEVTCANWFGQKANVGGKGVQIVTGPQSGERHEFEFDHFNMEVDPFPYRDESFALVFFCEILEHLPMDPVNALAEIHRILEKPHGVLVLSTPNPARTENLIKMIAGENVYEPLSGYGVHGRHNREYTVSELQSLLGELGFEVERAFTADVSPQVPAFPPWFSGLELSDRGEYVFVVARAVGEDRWRYPDWLYQSKHAMYRAVLPDVQVGQNDDIQTDGLHARESVAGREVRWMGKQPVARFLLAPQFEGSATLLIEGGAPPREVGQPITLYVELGENQMSHEILPGIGWFSFRFPVQILTGEQEVRLSADRTWRPADVGLTTDERELSLAISSVALEPVVEP
ncbi:MAG: methyltransferase domain-containing protein [Acidimicrobiia bacterium]